MTDTSRPLDYIIMTPTYNRGDLLRQICDKLANEANQKNLRCLHVILNDASALTTEEYQKISETYEYVSDPYRVSTITHTKNEGRSGFYQTINELWSQARRDEFKYAIQIPDDCLPCDNFLSRVTERFGDQRTRDTRHNVVALNIIPSCLRNWGESRFIDGAFIAVREFFEVLHWEMEPCTGRWADNPKAGSGIGNQITQRLKECPTSDISANQDVSWLKPLDVPSTMYLNDVRPQKWWRDNFVDK